MTRHRVILPQIQLPDSLPASSTSLDAETEHYLVRVLRARPGDIVEVCDGADSAWLAELIQSDEQHYAFQWVESAPTRSSNFPFVLAQGMPKADKLESILQKSTELGVTGFQPFFSKHCVVKPKPEKEAKKLGRWLKIVKEAARQCRRTDVPDVHASVSLMELCDVLPADLPKLVCWEGESSQSLRNWIQEHPDISGAVVAIGPEGGFSEDEITYLEQQGFVSVGLGPLILRTETAGPTVAALFQYMYGSLGDAVPES